eukprot:6186658-Pleurochrysis_carterae.AAC.1
MSTRRQGSKQKIEAQIRGKEANEVPGYRGSQMESKESRARGRAACPYSSVFGWANYLILRRRNSKSGSLFASVHTRLEVWTYFVIFLCVRAKFGSTGLKRLPPALWHSLDA